MNFTYDKKMLDLFWYWVNERHAIYCRRLAGKPWPWTTDEILQSYKFTNVFRNLDAVTKQLHERVFNFESRYKAAERYLFAITLFRMFNWPPTFELLREYQLDLDWNTKVAKKILDKVQGKIFTGAYMITNGGKEGSKIDLMCESLSVFFEDKKIILERIRERGSFKGACVELCAYPMIGKFIAYELATDYRWAKLFEPDDIYMWANPGPGAKRGINRILGSRTNAAIREELSVTVMRDLLRMTHKQSKEVAAVGMEMRDIEHSLCEFDKYTRVKLGEGRPRSLYTNPHMKESIGV